MRRRMLENAQAMASCVQEISKGSAEMESVWWRPRRAPPLRSPLRASQEPPRWRGAVLARGPMIDLARVLSPGESIGPRALHLDESVDDVALWPSGSPSNTTNASRVICVHARCHSAAGRPQIAMSR